MKFRVYGINTISTKAQGIKLDVVLHLLKNLREKEVERPSGKTEALIGLQYADYHPVQKHNEGHLLVISKLFWKVYRLLRS